MDKITGKHNVDQKYISRPETGKSELINQPSSQKLVKQVTNN